MRPLVAWCGVGVAVLMAGCASSEPPPTAPPLPPSVDNGLGSAHGNYAAQEGGEMRGEAGERCVVYDWDRPLNATLALRLRSASCESQERPGWMVSREIARTVIPLGESNLNGELGAAGR